MRRVIWMTCVLAVAGTGMADPSKLAFNPVENGYASFDTGVLKGRLRLDGRLQGISQLAYAPTGMELLKSVGLLSYYRVFSSGKRYGHAARDWPLEAELQADGALKVAFPPSAEHPLEMTAVFRWRSEDTLDLETTVTPQIAMPRMEVFLSSYLNDGFEGFAYLKPNRFDKTGKASFVRADWHELTDGNYLIFPRDKEVLPIIYDGRWEIPPSPVTWAFTRYFEAPIAIRRHREAGLTAAIMSPPGDCFAVSMPYNKQPADNVAGHGSIYMSLFGMDVAAGQKVAAHCRLIIAKDLSDELILERYRRYLEELGR